MALLMGKSKGVSRSAGKAGKNPHKAAQRDQLDPAQSNGGTAM